jgi:hypothetical protein
MIFDLHTHSLLILLSIIIFYDNIYYRVGILMKDGVILSTQFNASMGISLGVSGK